MATFTKVGTRVRAQIRRAGVPSITETHDSMEEAQRWARAKEVELDSGKKTGVHGKTGMTMGETIDRYIAEKKDLARMPIHILGSIKKGLGKIRLDRLTDDDIVGYIKSKDFSPASGGLHFSYIGTVLRIAKVGWKYHVPEILELSRERLKFLKLIGASNERTRRPTAEELAMLMDYDFPNGTPMQDIILFAMATTMRQAEITRIDHSTFDEEDRTILIKDRKHPKKKKGNHKTVPLLAEAIEIIKRQEKKEGDTRVFPFEASTVSTYFSSACKKLGIEDLHFHDLRHEGVSRLFEMGYHVHEVQMFSGHEDLKTLQRYMHLKPQNVRKLEVVKIEPATIETVPVDFDMAELEEFKQFQKMKKMMAMMKQAEAA